VTSAAGAVSEGSVTFTVLSGTTPVGSLVSGSVSNGSASATYTLPAGTAAGSYTVQVVYSPGPDFATSSDSSHSLIVIPAVRVTGAANNLVTVGTLDPTTATWYLRNSNTPGAPDAGSFRYGAPGWIGLAGDWDGNGTMTIGTFDPTTATWYLRNGNSPGAPDVTPFRYGAPSWIPVVGDWNGDGVWTIGVVDPTTMTWYLKNSNGPGAPDIAPFRYGAPGWLPVVGDWNGDGQTTVGVVDPGSMTWYLRNSNSSGGADIAPFAYGAAGWRAVVGDWDGDGVTTVGVFNPTGEFGKPPATWYLRNTNSPGAPDIAPFAYGATGWQPVAGAWAGPGRPLRVTGGPLAAASVVSPLTASDVEGIVAAALTRLQSDGAATATLAQLAATPFAVGRLGGGDLALARPGVVVVDATASGRGWFVDPTPDQDEEFVGDSGSTQQALSGGPAAGRVDLLTAVFQELGQVVGLTDAAWTAPLCPGVRSAGALGAAITTGTA
jgi:hypothetical protein